MKKRFLKGALALLVVAVALVAGFFAFLTIFNPVHAPIEPLEVTRLDNPTLETDVAYTATTFNIGYGGLGTDADFFADGGKSARAISADIVDANLEGIEAFIASEDADIYLLQEVDVRAYRSYDRDELTRLNTLLSTYDRTFTYNYNALWVPVPLFDPLGYSNSGLATYAKYTIESAARHALDGQPDWPMVLAELDRCFSEHVLPVEGGKKLYLINLHLSAYDKGGVLRTQQIEHLKRYMNALYDAGHYVVLGGDFNQQLNPAQMRDAEFMENWPTWLEAIPGDLVESGFKWAYDTEVNTVRDLKTAYKKGETFEATIDGFLVSPNVQIDAITGYDLGFVHSDHNPVTLTFRLK